MNQYKINIIFEQAMITKAHCCRVEWWWLWDHALKIKVSYLIKNNFLFKIVLAARTYKMFKGLT